MSPSSREPLSNNRVPSIVTCRLGGDFAYMWLKCLNFVSILGAESG